jgi:hypothetical protein
MEDKMTTEKLKELCPTIDALTLVRFQTDALQAWMVGPSNQDEYWLREYSAITNLLAESDAGPIELNLA